MSQDALDCQIVYFPTGVYAELAVPPGKAVPISDRKRLLAEADMLLLKVMASEDGPEAYDQDALAWMFETATGRVLAQPLLDDPEDVQAAIIELEGISRLPSIVAFIFCAPFVADRWRQAGAKLSRTGCPSVELFPGFARLHSRTVH